MWRGLVILFTVIFYKVECMCYLPWELQGVYLTEKIGGQQQGDRYYTEIRVLPNSIADWGTCTRRQDRNFILESESSSSRCYRCYRLHLRTPNVLQVYTEASERCYPSEREAVRSCPFDEGSLKKEFTLYRRRSYRDNKETGDIPQFCPIAGFTTFSYNINDGTETTKECPESTSTMTDCPTAHQLVVRFRQCTFPNYQVPYACLGDWEGPDGQRYLALMDTEQNRGSKRLFRCGLYSRDPKTNQIYLALSRDSTCENELKNSIDGYETFTITYRPQLRWPEEVERAQCNFPSWAKGSWETLIVEDTAVIHQEMDDFITYTSRCVGDREENRFLVYSRTSCGEDTYKCIWIEQRGPNVMEYKIGRRTSINADNQLCSDFNFDGISWNTQGRMELSASSCPISGEYTGQIPDGSRLEATIKSDCLQPDIMYYSVSSSNDSYTRNTGTDGRQGRYYSRYDDRGRTKRDADEELEVRSSIKVNHEEPIDIDLSSKIDTEKGQFKYERGYDPFDYHRNRDTSRDTQGSQSGNPDPNDGNDQSRYTNPPLTDPRGNPDTDPRDRRPDPDPRDRRPDVDPRDRRPDPDPRDRRPDPDPRDRRPEPDPRDRRPDPDYRGRPQYTDYRDNPSRGAPVDPYSLEKERDSYDRRPVREDEDRRGRPGYDYRENTRYSPGRDIEPYEDRYNPRRPDSQPPRDNRQFYSKESDYIPVVIKEEERTYRCLGQWEENGVLYTYTQRQSIPGYECFVGIKQNNGDVIEISEAGSDCDRNARSQRMRLTKQGPCHNSNRPVTTTTQQSSSRRPPVTYTTRQSTRTQTTDGWSSRFTPPTRRTTRRPPVTTKWRPSSTTWRPITGSPNKQPGGNGSVQRKASVLLLPLLLLWHILL